MRYLLPGIIGGGLLFWKWYSSRGSSDYSSDTSSIEYDTILSEIDNQHEITRFNNLFGSDTYLPCKCGFPRQVCNNCNSLSNTSFPANVILFSVSNEFESPTSGIPPFCFNTPLTIHSIDEIVLQLDMFVPIQYGTVMIHYPTTRGTQATELLWCANTSTEAKNIFPIRELLSRIIQIVECSESLGYYRKPISNIVVHDIDVYLM